MIKAWKSWLYIYWEPKHPNYPIVSIRIGSAIFKLKLTKNLLFSERYNYCKFRRDFRNGWSFILDWSKVR